VSSSLDKSSLGSALPDGTGSHSVRFINKRKEGGGKT
jgi:hypothetical protein